MVSPKPRKSESGISHTKEVTGNQTLIISREVIANRENGLKCPSFARWFQRTAKAHGHL